MFHLHEIRTGMIILRPRAENASTRHHSSRKQVPRYRHPIDQPDKYRPGTDRNSLALFVLRYRKIGTTLRTVCRRENILIPFSYQIMNDENVITYQCPSCGEENETFVDISGGRKQVYTEDCTVCCRPNVLTITISPEGNIFYRCCV